MSNAREIALKAIYRVNEENAFSNLVVNQLLNKSNLDKRDRALATQLIYGSIRWRNDLDWIINHFSNRKVKKMTLWVRNALRLGVYQIKYLDKIPGPVAANETVEVAKKHCNRGAVKFINGNLRNVVKNIDSVEYPDIAKNPVQYIRHYYSQPQWLVQRWVKRYGVDKTVEICEKLNQVPPTIIRTNTLKSTCNQVLNNLHEEGAKATSISYLPEAINLLDYSAITNLTAFQQGEFMVQGLSSMLVGHILDPSEDDFIIDLCGAPGGKTTHLAQLMNNQGQIKAVDLHDHKLDLINDNCQRLGIDNVATFCADGRKVEFDQLADKILVDAPCSGLGIIGKKPEIRWQKKPQDLAKLQDLQLELLSNAARNLKTGGELVYSTCTFTPEENKEVIEKFIAKSPQFSIVNLSSLADRLGVISYLEDNMIQILPDNELLEGFFIAKLKKSK